MKKILKIISKARENAVYFCDNETFSEQGDIGYNLVNKICGLFEPKPALKTPLGTSIIYTKPSIFKINGIITDIDNWISRDNDLREDDDYEFTDYEPHIREFLDTIRPIIIELREAK
jgi:hypothetical protein